MREKKPSRTEHKKSAGEFDKKIAALSYVFILFLIPLLGKPNNDFVQFHAKQGLVMFLIELAVFILAWIPLFGPLMVIATIIIAGLGIVKALNGERWEIPFVHEWSKKVKIN